MLRLAMTREQLRGQIVRSLLKKAGISARELGVRVGLHEANIATMLNEGQSFDKYLPQIEGILGISDAQFYSLYDKAVVVLVKNGVTIVPEYTTDHVILPLKNAMHILGTIK